MSDLSPLEAGNEQPPEADPSPSVPIPGHAYDGIREYDNPMPGWWVWIFWATAIFFPIYILGIHVFGFIDTYEEDLAEGQAELMEIRAAYQAAHPAQQIDEATLAAYIGEAARVEAGAGHYAAQCAACHGPAGQGLIGPNLTDAYTLHGNSNMDLYTVISAGVLDKGMPPWENVFGPEERAELVAFLRSLEGTNPPDAKPPQGDPFE